MKGFYGEPSEGKEGIVGGVAKALVKDPDNKGQSIVSGALTRNGDFEDFIISMDFQGVPYISVPSDGKPIHKTIKI